MGRIRQNPSLLCLVLKLSLLLTLNLYPPHSLALFSTKAVEVAKSRDVKNYPALVNRLLREGFYFASIPILKEYLVSHPSPNHKLVNQLINRIIHQVGVRQFELLEARYLERGKGPYVRYILAKNYLREGDLNRALTELNSGISRAHDVYPFSEMLKASIYSLLDKHAEAIDSFRNCAEFANSRISRASSDEAKNQLEIVRDYCVIGVPRTYFAWGKFDKANSYYLDLSKNSPVWPEILFEEAWTSFYLGDYNRSLGKLVTYNAPVLDHVYNPEVDVLRAFSYLKLCLYGDAEQVANGFYQKYQGDANELLEYLNRYGRDYKHFYFLAKSVRNSRRKISNELFSTIMRSVVRAPTYVELYNDFLKGDREIQRLSKIKDPAMKSFIEVALKEALVLHRDLIGAYVRKTIALLLAQTRKAFEAMSYIKLEVLSKKKARLYAGPLGERERGDIQYLKRNDKQYFWDFNGEFWADELGDYVFALPSECGEGRVR